MSNNIIKKYMTQNLRNFKKFNMTILVTGTSGFIGSNLVRYLQKKNLKFYGVDKISNPYFKFKNFYKINLER